MTERISHVGRWMCGCLSNLGDGDGGMLIDADHKMLNAELIRHYMAAVDYSHLHTVSMAILDFINNYCIIILTQQLDWKSCAEYGDVNE